MEAAIGMACFVAVIVLFGIGLTQQNRESYRRRQQRSDGDEEMTEGAKKLNRQLYNLFSAGHDRDLIRIVWRDFNRGDSVGAISLLCVLESFDPGRFVREVAAARSCDGAANLRSQFMPAFGCEDCASVTRRIKRVPRFRHDLGKSYEVVH